MGHGWILEQMSDTTELTWKSGIIVENILTSREFSVIYDLLASKLKLINIHPCCIHLL